MQPQRVWSGVLLALCLTATAACSAPSIHGLASADNAVDDVKLAGAWVGTQGDVFFRVERTGVGEYVVDVALADPGGQPSRNVALDANLVELDGVRFIDLSLRDSERKALGAADGLMLFPHQFMRVQRKRDTLSLWSLEEAALKRAQADGTLSGTTAIAPAGPTFVLTSSTAQLQAFFTEHGHDSDLFGDSLVVHRVVAPAKPASRKRK